VHPGRKRKTGTGTIRNPSPRVGERWKSKTFSRGNKTSRVQSPKKWGEKSEMDMGTFSWWKPMERGPMHWFKRGKKKRNGKNKNEGDSPPWQENKGVKKRRENRI